MLDQTLMCICRTTRQSLCPEHVQPLHLALAVREAELTVHRALLRRIAACRETVGTEQLKGTT